MRIFFLLNASYNDILQYCLSPFRKCERVLLQGGT